MKKGLNMTTSKSAEFTAETLEDMFVYLGCANIPTQEAMDGAVPLESMLSNTSDEFAAVLAPGHIENMGAEWAAKAVCFSGSSLVLSTVENVHWSRISKCLSQHASVFRAVGMMGRKSFTDKAHGYAKLYYSEIDRFGRFAKFPISKKWDSGVVISKIYNPSWLLEFRGEEMRCISSDSDALYRERRLGFLGSFLCGLAQSMGSYWLVRTKFDAVCPSLTLLTDPTGVKEFWKLRDVPPGRARRTALLHWVSQHWRQKRADPDVEVFVREHMRGDTHVRQGHFEATITPSQEDTLRDKKAKEEREMLKKLRLDRKVRRRRMASKAR